MMAEIVDFFQSLVVPTMLPFTALMVLVILYWLTVIIGAMDLDMLDVDLDVDLDGGAEGAADGALEGLDGGADAGGESADAFVGSHEGALRSVLRFLNVGTVPLTIVLSIMIFCMWVLAYVLHLVLGQTLMAMMHLFFVFVVIGFISLAVALFATGFLTKPMRKLFIVHRRQGADYLIGHTCQIRSGTVTDHHGQAEIIKDGNHLILSVRCDANDKLGKNDDAVIVNYDATRNIYTIKPL